MSNQKLLPPLDRRPTAETSSHFQGRALELLVQVLQAGHTGLPDPRREWSTAEWLMYEEAAARDSGQYPELVRALSSNSIQEQTWEKIRKLERKHLHGEPWLYPLGRILARAAQGPSTYEKMGTAAAKEALQTLGKHARALTKTVRAIAGHTARDRRAWRMALREASYEYRERAPDDAKALDAACTVLASPEILAGLLDKAADLWQQTSHNEALVTKTDGKSGDAACGLFFARRMAQSFTARYGSYYGQLILDFGIVFFADYFDGKDLSYISKSVPKSVKRRSHSAS